MLALLKLELDDKSSSATSASQKQLPKKRLLDALRLVFIIGLLEITAPAAWQTLSCARAHGSSFPSSAWRREVALDGGFTAQLSGVGARRPAPASRRTKQSIRNNRNGQKKRAEVADSDTLVLHEAGSAGIRGQCIAGEDMVFRMVHHIGWINLRRMVGQPQRYIVVLAKTVTQRPRFLNPATLPALYARTNSFCVLYAVT